MKRKNVFSAVLIILTAISVTFILTIERENGNYEVLRVADGDSFTLLRNNTKLEIRLYGIDCPERKQPFHKKAERLTSSVLQKGEIRFTEVDLDRYGRMVAWVYVDSLNLNEELVRHGLAWHYKHHSHDANLARLEDSARTAKAGLWSDPRPISPWEFRKRKGGN